MALKRVRGAYAIAVVSGDAPDEIFVARDQSPLVLGSGEGEMLAASDIPALLAHTREVIFLHDGDIATLTKSGAEITTLDGTSVQRASKHILQGQYELPSGIPYYEYERMLLGKLHDLVLADCQSRYLAAGGGA